MGESRKPRVLMARFDLDGHDRGVLSIMNAMRDAGMEVIYVHFSNPKELAKIAIEEDVDVIGITSSLGEHLLLTPLLHEELQKNGVSLPIIVGGVIPGADGTAMREMGVVRVFGPGSTPQEAISFVSELVRNK